MRPRSAETSEPAWVKRKILSMKNSTSWPLSRKSSATVRPLSPTRGARPRRLVHLAIHQGAFGALGGAAMLARIHIHLGFDHFVIKIVALAGPLAYPGEHGIAAVRLGDIVDEFHDQNRFADPGAAEEPDLAAFRVRRQKIDDLNAGHQDLRLGRLFGIGGRGLMDRAPRRGFERTQFVHRLADDIDDAAKARLAYRHRDWASGIPDRLAADKAFGNVHRDAAHRIFAKMLRDFKDQAVAAIVGFERVEDFRQIAVEFHIDDGANDLRDAARARVGCGVRHALSSRQVECLNPSALSPPFVNARVRFLAPLPGKSGIVRIPFGAAAIVGGWIVAH